MAKVSGMEWSTLATELELVLATFEEDQILILQRRGTGRYVQLYVNEPGSLHVEVSSNNYLAKENVLTEQQEASLRALGWRPPLQGRSPNFSTDLKGPQATAQAVTLTVKTLAEVLETGSPADLEYDAFEARGGPMVLPPLKLERMRRGAR
jgi:hypothetical protein